MRDLAILFVHLLTTIARLMCPGGARAVVAESLLLKHQLVVLNRGRKRATNLRPMDRVMVGLCTLFIHPSRLLRVAVVLRPSTLPALRGLMQLIPETARCYGVIDATDSAQNVDAGLRYLKTLQSQSGRLDHLIIGADMATSLASLGFF